jgi:D-aminopeptidase
VVATDAPFLPSQITRLCKRAALGIGRVLSFAKSPSGGSEGGHAMPGL